MLAAKLKNVASMSNIVVTRTINGANCKSVALSYCSFPTRFMAQMCWACRWHLFLDHLFGEVLSSMPFIPAPTQDAARHDLSSCVHEPAPLCLILDPCKLPSCHSIACPPYSVHLLQSMGLLKESRRVQACCIASTISTTGPLQWIMFMISGRPWSPGDATCPYVASANEARSNVSVIRSNPRNFVMSMESFR